MEYVRTPEERFENLPEFGYAPHYLDVPAGDGGALRMAYIDEGPRDAAPILMLHGEPSWSFLYRKMIRVLVAHGHRCVAPDLIGFGRSDKPTRREDYTYARHLGWLRSWLESLDLKDITLVCQDWGGLLGLRLLVEQPQRFARCVAANTMLPTGDMNPGAAFEAWKTYSQTTPDFKVGGIVNGGCSTDLSPELIAAYDAPFPDDTFKAGARMFPLLVPVTPDDPEAPANRKACAALCELELPFLTAFSDEDPIMKGLDRILQASVAGAKGQPHTTIVGGGHFLQEDRGPELAEVVHQFIAGS